MPVIPSTWTCAPSGIRRVAPGTPSTAGMPRSLMGPRQVSTWSPAQLGVVDDAYLDRLHLLYRSDPVLANPFEAALQQRDVASVEVAARGRGGRIEPVFTAEVRDDEGNVVAEVEKVLYVRRKEPSPPAPLPQAGEG